MRKWSKRGSRFEVSTYGRDPALALIKGNPYGTVTGPGLIIPATPPSVNVASNRYLFMLAQWSFNVGEYARLVGMRQYLTLGALVPVTSDNPDDSYNYIVEQPVVTPTWHPSDATVSWHLRRTDIQPNVNIGAFNKPNYCYRQSDNPALLYENDFTQPNGYEPPFGGEPPGNIMVPDLGAFQDIRFPWSERQWESLGVEIEGPCRVALYASVQQTSPNMRPVLPAPTVPFYGGGLVPEEQFLLNYPQAVLYRIAGSLIFERQPMLRERGNIAPWNYPVNRRVATGDTNDTDYHPPFGKRSDG